MNRLLTYILFICALLFPIGTHAQRLGKAPNACTIDIYTETVKMVLGQYTVRRRVVYETSKPILSDEYDATMYALGLQWGDHKRACRAQVQDMNVYYHGVALPGGVYVIDSSEEQSTAGKQAHECLLERFTELLVQELGCVVNEEAVKAYV